MRMQVVERVEQVFDRNDWLMIPYRQYECQIKNALARPQRQEH